MDKKSQLHYYQDGDILIYAEDTYFCVHKIILSMASPTLLSIIEQRENALPLINLPDISASTIEIALSIIYPRYFLMPTWNNVDALLQLASDYVINKIYVACVAFLDQNYKQNPMYTFYLADKYQFSYLFQETSKLVLDKFPEYQEETAFKRLPMATQLELEKRYLNFSHSFARLSIKHFISTYKHICGNSAFHNKELNQEIEPRVLTIIDPSFKSPSSVWNIMHAHINATDDRIECNDYFMNNHLPTKFKEIFGSFKCLDVDKNEKNPNHYIYLKMKKKSSG
jgi:hypothetical protein